MARDRKNQLSITYKKESIQEMSFESNFFDRVFCISVIEHVPKSQWKSFMGQLIRVLKLSGQLILTMDLPSFDVFRYEGVLSCCNVQSLGEIDHSIPPSIRHPNWRYETVGLVLIKKENR